MSCNTYYEVWFAEVIKSTWWAHWEWLSHFHDSTRNTILLAYTNYYRMKLVKRSYFHEMWITRIQHPHLIHILYKPLLVQLVHNRQMISNHSFVFDCCFIIGCLDAPRKIICILWLLKWRLSNKVGKTRIKNIWFEAPRETDKNFL